MHVVHILCTIAAAEMLGKDTAVLVRLCHVFRFTMRQMFSADGSFGMQASKFSTWTLPL